METLDTPKNVLLSWIFWIKKKLQDKEPSRYLKVTPEGYFYLFVTIALGVSALISGNNILYLLDSILLTGLAFSGIVSDRTIRGVQIDVKPNQAFADEPTYDIIRIHNTRRYPIFLIHIDEISNFGSQRIAVISKIEGRSTIQMSSIAKYPNRGRVEIYGYSVGSFFPFGLAEKKIPLEKKWSRIVWPKRTRATELNSENQTLVNSIRTGSFLTEGEVRPLNIGEDSRNVVWTLSSKFEDELYSRPRRVSLEKLEIFLDIENFSKNDLEVKISEIATIYYNNDFGQREIRLTIRSYNSTVTFTEKNTALNELALIQKTERQRE